MNDYYLEKSDDNKHKYMIYFVNPQTKNVNTIRFGAKGMNDYTITGDDKAKIRYIKRHQKNEDFGNLKKKAPWSLFLLWNKKSLNESIKDMEERFNIKIHTIE